MKQVIALILAAAAGGAVIWFVKSGPEDHPPAAPAGNSASSKSVIAPAVTPASAPAGNALPVVPGAADKAVAELKGQVVVSLGKVEDIGRQAAVMLLTEKELAALRAIDAAARTPEQRRRLLELERQRAATLGMLPEVAQFQNNPDEYARFFGSLLTEAAGLDAAQTKTVTEFLRRRGEAMIAAGLNAAKEPGDAAQEEVWEEKRDGFNEETVEGVAQLLPPGTAERIGFTDKFMELMEQDFDKAQ